MADAQGEGKKSEEVEWRQGSLLPLLSSSAVFDPAHPETPISRAAVEAGAANEVKAPEGIPPHSIASGLPSSKVDDRWLAIISQTCDIAKPASAEPYVLACYAFLTDKERILTPASRDSANQFVLNPESGLIVDIRTIVVIEKGLLKTLGPQDSGASTGQLRRFARWLAFRYSRPAHPDSFVESVGHAIRDLFRRLHSSGSFLAAALKEIRQIRVNVPSEVPPFDVQLFIILDDKYSEAVPEGLQLAIAELAALIEKAIKDVSRLQWYSLTLEQMSARTWLDTDALFLEDLTYTPAGTSGVPPP